jgi:membrane protein DedA with SNARE-associated domain
MDSGREMESVMEALTIVTVILLTCIITIIWLKRKGRKKK